MLKIHVLLTIRVLFDAKHTFSNIWGGLGYFDCDSIVFYSQRNKESPTGNPEITDMVVLGFGAGLAYSVLISTAPGDPASPGLALPGLLGSP